MKAVSRNTMHQKITLKKIEYGKRHKVNLEIIAKIGEYNAEFYNLYLKGVLSETELKILIGHQNYTLICSLRQQKQ